MFEKFLQRFIALSLDMQLRHMKTCFVISLYLLTSERRIIQVSSTHVVKTLNPKRLEPRNQFSFVPQPDGIHSLDQYHSSSEINEILMMINDLCDECSIIVAGYSRYNNPIYILKVVTDEGKPAVFLNGGFHAREWISPATVLALAYHFAVNPSKDAVIEDLRKTFSWYFLVLSNPDGYDYSRLSLATRMWRKNRSPAENNTVCRGVDLNRNFDFHWGESLSGNDPCKENYHGGEPFSEPETRSIRNFAHAHANQIFAYLSFHSFGQKWLYPWLYTNCSKPPHDAKELKRLADIAVDEMKNFSGARYQTGQAGCLLYPANGAASDWMKYVIGVKYSYTVELPDSEHGRYGFLLPPASIIPVAAETLAGVKAFSQALAQLTN